MSGWPTDGRQDMVAKACSTSSYLNLVAFIKENLSSSLLEHPQSNRASSLQKDAQVSAQRKLMSPI